MLNNNFKKNLALGSFILVFLTIVGYIGMLAGQSRDKYFGNKSGGSYVRNK